MIVIQTTMRYCINTMGKFNINEVMKKVRTVCNSLPTPSVTVIAAKDRSPFKVLVSCIISLRTRDEVTAIASNRLFSLADTPEKLVGLGADKVAEAIYPAGFYKTKARQLVEISGQLVSKFHGEVPERLDELLQFKGVGRKTANLVLTQGFGLPGICVDTHVHRIVNRWGYLKTKNAEETEMELRRKLPHSYWIEINELLVAFGQCCCTPVSPRCSSCVLITSCKKVGVKKFR